LLAVDTFCEDAVKKGVTDIHLMNRPRERCDEVEHDAHSGRLDDGTEGFTKVNTGVLMKARTT
jgi:hypothetical protein